MIPAIFGLSGLTLTDDERAFFRDSDPAGYILFGRNIENREQLRRLTDALRAPSAASQAFREIAHSVVRKMRKAASDGGRIRRAAAISGDPAD